MKSDFVSNVSHELRTPLTSIKGSVENMLDGLTGSLNEKQIRYLVRIKSNTDRLSRLINDLLDLSRIESGRVEVRPTRLPLTALAEEVAEHLKPLATEKLIRIEVPSSDPQRHRLGGSRQSHAGLGEPYWQCGQIYATRG